MAGNSFDVMKAREEAEDHLVQHGSNVGNTVACLLKEACDEIERLRAITPQPPADKRREAFVIRQTDNRVGEEPNYLVTTVNGHTLVAGRHVATRLSEQEAEHWLGATRLAWPMHTFEMEPDTQPPVDLGSWSAPPLKPDGTVEARVEPGELPPPEWGPPADLAETVAEMERLYSEASTSAPWEWEQRGPDGKTWSLMVPQRVFPERPDPFCWGHPLNLLNTDATEWDRFGPQNRALIIAAVNALPSLLAAIKRRSEDAEVGELVRRAKEHLGGFLVHWQDDGSVMVNSFLKDGREATKVHTGDVVDALRQLLGVSDG